MNKNIKTLWVDDKIAELKEAYSGEAEGYGVILVSFNCWEAAKLELSNHYDEYSAIILDAKCKIRPNDPDDTMKFLPKVFEQLSVMAIERHRTIPWFVLSAGSGDVGRLDWVKEGRLAWDDWEKDFYSKLTDRPDLFSRIPEIAVHSDATQIQTILYRDVFESFDSIKGLDNKIAKQILIDVLLALHFPQGDFKPLLYYNQLRQLVEHLFRACNKVGLVPDQCIPNGVVNLDQSLRYLSGKDAVVVGVRFGSENDRIVTPHIEREIHSVLNLGNVNSHTVELNDADKKTIDELFKTVNSRYVIFSLALQMCDVVVWLKDCISEHNSKEENLKKCVSLLEEAKKKYEGQEVLPNKDSDGEWYYGDCLLGIKIPYPQTILIENVAINGDKRTNRKYKFFAKCKIKH